MDENGCQRDVKLYWADSNDLKTSAERDATAQTKPRKVKRRNGAHGTGQEKTGEVKNQKTKLE